MKKSTIYAITLLLFVAATGFIIFKYKSDERKKQTTLYELQPRKGPSANTEEWISTKRTAAVLLQSLKVNPADTKSSLALAALFVQEARVTGNHVYYDQAALKHVNDVLKADSANFNALIFKSLIYLSQHHFAEGLAIAQKAQTINPYNAFVYGIIVDGLVEMGDYQAAVENSDKMVSIRPDLNSYSRISYLREIHGDYPGAISAMKMAVDAGPPGDEQTEWARVQLGHLYEFTGEMKYAEMHYTIALNQRPGYAYAIAGLARVALAGKDYDKSISLYKQADSLVYDYSLQEDLIEVYRLKGDNNKADALAKAVIRGMSKDSELAGNDESIGHYGDRELAYAYLKVNNYDKALEHALVEYNRRPENIDVNETVAWVYYKQGEYTKALPYIKTALRTKCKNPTLLSHAGLIYAKAGDKSTGKAMLEEGLKNNPNMSGLLNAEAREVLKTL